MQLLFSLLCRLIFLVVVSPSFSGFFHIVGVNLGLSFCDVLREVPGNDVISKVREGGSTFMDLLLNT